MAITAQALTLTGSGGSPTALTPAGQIAWSFGDVQQPAFVGTVTFTGDTSTTAAVINWIDGTQTIPFTPSAVLVFLIGGTDTAGVLRVEGSAVNPRVTSITNVSATVNYSTAPGAATSKLLVIVYK
jgi:hypothetical protein